MCSSFFNDASLVPPPIVPGLGRNIFNCRVCSGAGRPFPILCYFPQPHEYFLKRLNDTCELTEILAGSKRKAHANCPTVVSVHRAHCFEKRLFIMSPSDRNTIHALPPKTSDRLSQRHATQRVYSDCFATSTPPQGPIGAGKSGFLWDFFSSGLTAC